jgi:hypothetical protein
MKLEMDALQSISKNRLVVAGMLAAAHCSDVGSASPEESVAILGKNNVPHQEYLRTLYPKCRSGSICVEDAEAAQANISTIGRKEAEQWISDRHW